MILSCTMYKSVGVYIGGQRHTKGCLLECLEFTRTYIFGCVGMAGITDVMPGCS